MNRLDALHLLKNTLTSLSQDIDFSSSSDSIKGVIFISNQCVHFAIHLHENQQEHSTCVEYRRMSGDSIASARFWTQIQDLLRRKELSTMDTSIDESLPSLPPQELDASYLE